jgi:branched-chain amino acid transport system substrate-binding protein
MWAAVSRWSVSGMLLVLFVTSCSGSAGSSTAAFKGGFSIGVDLPQSGAEAVQGRTVFNGIRFAADEANRHGGVAGYKVEIVNLDDVVGDAHNADKGAENARVLVANPAVLGMVGPYNSNVGLAQVPVTNQAHLAQVSPANANECLTKDIPSCKGQAKAIRPAGINNYFRVVSTSDVEGPIVVDYARDTLGLERIAIGSDSELYGKGIADQAARELTARGGQVIDRRDFDRQSGNDFRAWLRQARADGAQAVYFGGTDATGACLIRAQMREVFPPDAPELGGGLVTPKCLTDAGENAVGMLGDINSVDLNQTAQGRAWLTSYRRAFPQAGDLGSLTVQAYTATAVLLDAIGRAARAGGGRLPSRDQVLTELALTSGFDSPLGRIGFDRNGDVVPQVVTLYESKHPTDTEAGLAPSCTSDRALCWVFRQQLARA